MKVIFHCGASKNGSTAIQTFLQQSENRLALNMTGVILVAQPLGRSFDATDKTDIRLASLLTPIDRNGMRTDASFALFYELYKEALIKRDLSLLKKLFLEFQRILDVYDSHGFQAVVISAEALETSLCLKDRIFKRFVSDLSFKFDISLIYYKPDAAMHALRSWAQWSYIEHIPYSIWLRDYLFINSARDFFSSQRSSYWGNLINVKSWAYFWKFKENVSLSILDNISNTAEHFASCILGLRYDEHSESQRMNYGWPKNLYMYLPLFYSFIASDYDKYEVIRQLFVDKNLRSGLGDLFFSRLLDLTRLILACDDGVIDSSRRQSCLEETENMLLEIEALFAQFPAPSLEIFNCLCDSLYYNHLRMYSPRQI